MLKKKKHIKSELFELIETDCMFNLIVKFKTSFARKNERNSSAARLGA